MAQKLVNTELFFVDPRKGADQPTVAAVRTALLDEGFDSEVAADIDKGTAFSRAVAAQKQGTDMEVKVVGKKVRRGQLDRLVVIDEDDDHRARVKREYVAHWVFREEKDGSYTITGSSELNITPYITTYEWSDLTQIVKKIIKNDGGGAHSPKKNGNIYFAALCLKPFLDRLERAMSSVGMEMVRFEVDDTDVHRGRVADAILHTLTQDLEAHKEAVDSYTEITRAGVVDNRARSIEETRRWVNTLHGYIEGQCEPVMRSLATLDEGIAAAREKIANYRPAPRGRLVATVTSQAGVA